MTQRRSEAAKLYVRECCSMFRSKRGSKIRIVTLAWTSSDLPMTPVRTKDMLLETIWEVNLSAVQ